ncbi:MAG: class I SAM-dependent methyltransferase [Pseudomonadota bacterium]
MLRRVFTAIRGRWRRFFMGLATLVGQARGFFSPYRYAQSVKPIAYPELEVVFRAASPDMLVVLDGISGHMDRLAGFAGPPPEPRWDQSWFPRLDGAAAYTIARAAAPARMIEVGSGHSTRMLMKALEDAGGQGFEMTCIDPEPRADLAGLGVRLERRVLDEIDIPRFAELEPGDIAFFDSSHILWPGSDVDLILNRIIPKLHPGVLVHLHDITLPDAYPESWSWRGYTEQNGLVGWLGAEGLQIMFSSHYALTRLGAADRLTRIPLPKGALETSLWLRRC